MTWFSLAFNSNVLDACPYGGEAADLLNPEGLSKAKKEITSWPGFAPTCLIALPKLAEKTGVASIFYKDEGSRFGLGSFKPLGGAYAVSVAIAKEVERQSGIYPTSSQLIGGEFRKTTEQITVCAATDGNHGRAVAWGARMFGACCVIFINEAVTKGRENAIASYGAHVERIAGSYDDAVRAAQERADQEGWFVIADTSDGSIIEAPRNVMQGYALMADEAIQQLPSSIGPSHVFLQAGVGGMAAANCAQFWQAYGADRPMIILVEPKQCASWDASLQVGQPVEITGDIDSVMAGLSCGEVSMLAWPILRDCADAMIAIEDEAAIAAMQLLADAPYGDIPVVAGESGVGGLAGFLAVAQDDEARHKLGINSDSHIMLFGTEGDTDPVAYQQYVGRSADEVRHAALDFNEDSK